jgi:hypothetical protein
MPHGFPPPPLIADDAAPEALALERLCPSPDVKVRSAFAAGALFKPPRVGLR